VARPDATNDPDYEHFANEKTAAKRKKQIKILEQQDAEDIRTVLSTAAGRRFIWRILDQSKMLAPDMFTGNSTTFHNLGKRDLGLWLYNEIMGADPKGFLAMMENQLKEQQDG